MKKSILMSAFLLTSAFSLINYSQAQAVSPFNNMLTLSNGGIMSQQMQMEEEAAVHSKVLKAFRRTFKVSVPVRWSTDENFYLAYFEKDGIQHRITYRKNGQMIQTMKTYSVKHLDREVKARVEEAYDGYDITGATEVITGQETVYFVNIESRRKLKELIVFNGDVTLRKEFMLQ